MEFVMTTELDKALPMEITFNYDELKTELTESLKKYNDMVVTEEEISGAKKDRAALNKLHEVLNRQRIDVKKAFMKPYEAFEAKIKELQSMVMRPIGAIDGQIKAFEEVKRQEKERHISEIYAGKIGDMSEVLPLDKLWNPRWLNATYKLEDIEKEIADMVFKASNDLKIIQVTCGEYAPQVMDKYLQTMDMSAALAEKARLEDQAEALKKVVPMEHKVYVAPNDGILPMEPEGEYTQVLSYIDFRVWATHEQLMLLKAFLKDNKIKYGRVQ